MNVFDSRPNFSKERKWLPSVGNSALCEKRKNEMLKSIVIGIFVLVPIDPNQSFSLSRLLSTTLGKEVIKEKAPFPGYMYRPKDDAAHPGILILHGSDGGNGDFWHFPGKPPANVGEKAGTPQLARHYASLGYVTYALCYFDCMHHEGYDDYPPKEY